MRGCFVGILQTNPGNHKPVASELVSDVSETSRTNGNPVAHKVRRYRCENAEQALSSDVSKASRTQKPLHTRC